MLNNNSKNNYNAQRYKNIHLHIFSQHIRSILHTLWIIMFHIIQV